LDGWGFREPGLILFHRSGYLRVEKIIMDKLTIKFSRSSTDFYFDGRFAGLKKIVPTRQSVLITDEHIYQAHRPKFKGWNTIILKPGEEFKVQTTVDAIVGQLLEMEADRSTTLVGVGGGVVCDITGFVAAIFMRGLRFGFVPTSVLAMVDAAIGGKNGINAGVYKNIVGTIRQPSFLFYDHDFLKTLPDTEWENGFAEIIKHACIRDPALFNQLEKAPPGQYRKDKKKLEQLIRRNATIKIRVVQEDEFENGERRLLNFGHTLGHALENLYELPHGHAISIGMVTACHLSEAFSGFKDTERVVRLLEKYRLPAYARYSYKKVFDIMKMDKKRVKKEIRFVLLEKIGRGTTRPIPIPVLEKAIRAV
jgi:3-dehydroquinate synthase